MPEINVSTQRRDQRNRLTSLSVYCKKSGSSSINELDDESLRKACSTGRGNRHVGSWKIRNICRCSVHRLFQNSKNFCRQLRDAIQLQINGHKLLADKLKSKRCSPILVQLRYLEDFPGFLQWETARAMSWVTIKVLQRIFLWPFRTESWYWFWLMQFGDFRTWVYEFEGSDQYCNAKKRKPL